MDDIGLWAGIALGGAGATVLGFVLESWRRRRGRGERRIDELGDNLDALRNLPNAVAELSRDIEGLEERVADARERLSELTGLVRAMLPDDLRRR